MSRDDASNSVAAEVGTTKVGTPADIATARAMCRLYMPAQSNGRALWEALLDELEDARERLALVPDDHEALGRRHAWTCAEVDRLVRRCVEADKEIDAAMMALERARRLEPRCEPRLDDLAPRVREEE